MPQAQSKGFSSSRNPPKICGISATVMVVTIHDQSNHVLYVDSQDHVLYGVITAEKIFPPCF
jgi:hypothetical protein